MMRSRLLFLFSMGLLLALMLGACATAPPTPTEEATAEPMAEEAIVPAVVVRAQDVSDGTVTVEEVISAGPGWIVIHASADGKPGPILGFSAVGEGYNDGVEVNIDLERATEQLFAMLHVDAGQVGTFEFPDGEDVPARVGETIVNVPFQVKMKEMAGEGAMVAVADSSLGEILVDAEGFSLYMFTPDSPGESTCYGRCADNWPPLLTEGPVVAGEGVDASLLGTTERSDGATQVTYNGWPLYYFFRDAAPGDLNGQGVGDVWFVLSPSGEIIAETP